MSLTWYDSALDPDPNDPGWFDIDRIYCFDWDAFVDSHWESLADAYTKLPSVRPTAQDSCPRWYSDEDDAENGYLTASVEPPGLQVFGVLRESDLSQWHDAFMALVSSLPSRTLE